MVYDMKITGGHVIDTTSGIDKIMDIYIKDGLIVDAPVSQDYKCNDIIDAQGCYVFPSFTDSHAHLFYGGSDIGMYSDLSCIPSGVTCAIDAGTTGCSNFEAFYENVIVESKMDIIALLNVSSSGITTFGIEENIDPRFYNVEKIKNLFHKYKKFLKGLKVRQNKDVVNGLGNIPLKETQKIAKTIRSEGLDCNVTVHFADIPCEVDDIMSQMGKDDVIAHVFTKSPKGILDEKGKVLDCVKKARERGVVFDSCGGRFHLSYEIASSAFAEGFFPDIIGSDLVFYSMYKRPVFSLLYIMSVILNLGMDINSIIRAVTTTPAKTYKLTDFSQIKAGSAANIAIVKLENKEIVFNDAYGYKVSGDKLLIPMATIKNGVTAFRQIYF